MLVITDDAHEIALCQHFFFCNFHHLDCSASPLLKSSPTVLAAATQSLPSPPTIDFVVKPELITSFSDPIMFGLNRLTRLAFDLVAISTIIAGIKKSTGFA
jgi:hypothetical protein